MAKKQSGKPNNDENTGRKREYKVGYKKPPKKYQFKKGNKEGEKKKGTISIVSLIKRILKEKAKTTDGTKKERCEVLARNIVAMAIQNMDKDMIKLIVQYVDGMPKQSIDFKDERALNQLVDELNGETNPRKQKEITE